MTKKPSMLERCGVADEDSAASWDICVLHLLGPVTLADEQERRRQALMLASAALRSAGVPDLVAALKTD